MASYTRQDIQMSDDGDFVVSSAGDLALASANQTVRQDLLLNSYTMLGDFEAFPTMGSRLYTFIGEPNTRQNAGLVQGELLRSLTSNGYFLKEDIKIRVIPISMDSIAMYLDLNNDIGLGDSSLVFDFNYIKGLQVES